MIFLSIVWELFLKYCLCQPDGQMPELWISIIFGTLISCLLIYHHSDRSSKVLKTLFSVYQLNTSCSVPFIKIRHWHRHISIVQIIFRYICLFELKCWIVWCNFRNEIIWCTIHTKMKQMEYLSAQHVLLFDHNHAFLHKNKIVWLTRLIAFYRIAVCQISSAFYL